MYIFIIVIFILIVTKSFPVAYCVHVSFVIFPVDVVREEVRGIFANGLKTFKEL